MDTWNRLAHVITHHAGSKHAFGVALALILVWVGSGIGAGPTRAWELAVTCGVPIVTLLMVIVLQHTQNRDTQSLQIKLNELLLALEEPDDQIIHAGRLGDEELDDLDSRQAKQAQSPTTAVVCDLSLAGTSRRERVIDACGLPVLRSLCEGAGRARWRARGSQ